MLSVPLTLAPPPLSESTGTDTRTVRDWFRHLPGSKFHQIFGAKSRFHVPLVPWNQMELGIGLGSGDPRPKTQDLLPVLLLVLVVVRRRGVTSYYVVVPFTRVPVPGTTYQVPIQWYDVYTRHRSVRPNRCQHLVPPGAGTGTSSSSHKFGAGTNP